MVPLTATQRQIAVNRRLLERQHFDYLTSATEHPVWYPMEFDQLLEDFALAKNTRCGNMGAASGGLRRAGSPHTGDLRRNDAH